MLFEFLKRDQIAPIVWESTLKSEKLHSFKLGKFKDAHVCTHASPTTGRQYLPMFSGMYFQPLLPAYKISCYIKINYFFFLFLK